MKRSGERTEGATPVGGVASIAFFSNDDGALPTDEGATAVEVHELDAEGRVIARTYATLT